MAEHICRRCYHSYVCGRFNENRNIERERCSYLNDHFVGVDSVVSVVRCHDCIYATPLDRNCELNVNAYMHCNAWHGEETKNVWHKYKKYYKDYSLVMHGDFCSYGERRVNDGL